MSGGDREEPKDLSQMVTARSSDRKDRDVHEVECYQATLFPTGRCANARPTLLRSSPVRWNQENKKAPDLVGRFFVL